MIKSKYIIIILYLKELAEEGDSGRKQISQYTRYLAVVLAVFQSLVMSFSKSISLVTEDTSL